MPRTLAVRLNTSLAVLSPPVIRSSATADPAVFLPDFAPVFQFPETVQVVANVGWMVAVTRGAVPRRVS